jgi:transposase
MKRFVEGDDRKQVALLECVDDYIGQDNPVRVIDVFVDELELEDLGFNGATPAVTGRPSYHPGVTLKIYVYGYLNRVPSSRRLERECQRNVELMWLTGRLAPDFKTIADFRRDLVRPFAMYAGVPQNVPSKTLIRFLTGRGTRPLHVRNMRAQLLHSSPLRHQALRPFPPL